MVGLAFSREFLSTSTIASSPGKEPYPHWVGAAVIIGMVLGVFTIIPTTILGILTLPITTPLMIVKVINVCAKETEWWSCVFTMIPFSDMVGINMIGSLSHPFEQL